jgi:non-homologous end joining protein Ku
MAYRNLNMVLGLVNVPVGIDSLTDRSARPAGKTFDPETLEPIKRPKVESVTLYEREDGALVDIGEVEKDETSSLLELTGFVTHVPMEMVETTYQVSPGKGGEKGLATIRLALMGNGAYGVGIINWDKAPRQVAIEATEWGVAMHVLTYADQFRPTKSWAEGANLQTTEAEVHMAAALIQAGMKDGIKPIADAHAKRMRDAIAAGEVVKESEKKAEDAPKGADLLETLRASMEASEKAKVTA